MAMCVGKCLEGSEENHFSFYSNSKFSSLLAECLCVCVLCVYVYVYLSAQGQPLVAPRNANNIHRVQI